MNEIISFIYSNIEIFVTLTTMVVVWILGKVSKKSPYVNNNLIIFQNIFVGLTVFILYFICTKDISIAVALSGIFATTGYDMLHNAEKLIQQKN